MTCSSSTRGARRSATRRRSSHARRLRLRALGPDETGTATRV